MQRGARVQVRALRDARGRAGGVGRRHRGRARAGARRRSCIPRTSTARRRSPLDELAPLARAAGVPVVVDAAYLSFPLSELARWSAAGDVACFSAKYFWGPNGGGFVAGRARAGRRRRGARLHRLRVRAVADVRAGVEARPRDGRGDRAPRWRSGRRSITRRGCAATRRWRSAAARCALPGAASSSSSSRSTSGCVDGPVNAVVGRTARPRWRRRWPPATRASGRWSTATRSSSAPRRCASREVDEIGAALSAVWPN